ncbi:SDR family oxidoreductase, partial [Bosea sp. (in: a-proteobacteria)]|uniref:SDR family oxidoreductase n=1 Tax=Bosea sp. (in: a-proteobacteria) TaxID=1871050 RepID=UPI002FC7895B
LGYRLRTPYAASKWAVIGLTESLAIELGPDDIRVNAILPGIVESERVEQVAAAKAQARGISVEAMKDEILSQVSLKRMVPMADIAAMAVFLAGPGGRSLTGQSLSVCAGVRSLS